MRISTISSRLVAIVVAAAATVPHISQDYNVYFKNENKLPIAPIGQLIGNYNSLNWGLFTLVENGTDGTIGGLFPSTPPKSGYFAGSTQRKLGNSFVSLEPLSKWSYFGLHGFHFGCIFTEIVANVDCRIQISGFYKGMLVNSTEALFESYNGNAAYMAHSHLPETFAKVDQVSFSLLSATYEIGGVALVIDNIYYTTYY